MFCQPYQLFIFPKNHPKSQPNLFLRLQDIDTLALIIVTDTANFVVIMLDESPQTVAIKLFKNLKILNTTPYPLTQINNTWPKNGENPHNHLFPFSMLTKLLCATIKSLTFVNFLLFEMLKLQRCKIQINQNLIGIFG